METLARPAPPRPERFAYQPALDGVRALAVSVVLLFHADVPGFGGGYVGVSVFFTLSGFLITSLLIREHRAEGRVHAGESYLLELPVNGAYFQVVDYSAISDRDDLSFCEWLTKEHGVAAIPVSAFYETPPEMKLIRFCFAK